jgi:hypothetical protein
MSGFRFDWRWAALILFVALIAGGPSLPWPIVAGAFAAAGGYLIYLAWQSLGGSPGPGQRVTYWRGQRVELPSAPRRRRPLAWRSALPALAYGIVGLAMLLAAAAVVLIRTA